MEKSVKMKKVHRINLKACSKEMLIILYLYQKQEQDLWSHLFHIMRDSRMTLYISKATLHHLETTKIIT